MRYKTGKAKCWHIFLAATYLYMWKSARNGRNFASLFFYGISMKPRYCAFLSISKDL